FFPTDFKMTTTREHKGHRVAKNSIRLRAKTEEGKCPTDVISWQDSPPQEPVRSFPAARFLRRPRPCRPCPTGSMCTTISHRRGGRGETSKPNARDGKPCAITRRPKRSR